MPPTDATPKTSRLPLYLIFAANAITFIVWVFFVLKHLIDYVRANFVDIFALPELLAAASSFVLAFTPSFIVMAVSLYWYQRWYSSNRSKLAQEQLANLSDARQSLLAAAVQLESFEHELRAKNAQSERLDAELASLRSLNAETADDLQKKLSALEILNKRSVWFERILSFSIGVASSLVASYVWQYVQTPPG
ncbi:MAG: hypothetical protein IPN53_13800 [Comamonadaceae bacterium]|nr:hypothetical protein [Comamonadaceae bacterium]